MIVPSTRYFTAGEVETGAYLNAAVTNLGNFLLGRPIAQLSTSSAQSFASGVTSAVTWTTSSINRDSSWSSLTNPTRFTANTAGWYWFSAGANFASTAATYKGTFLQVNGSTAVVGSSSISNTASSVFQSVSNGFVYLNATDYVELMGRAQGTTTALVAPSIGTTATAYLNAVWISL